MSIPDIPVGFPLIPLVPPLASSVSTESCTGDGGGGGLVVADHERDTVSSYDLVYRKTAGISVAEKPLRVIGVSKDRFAVSRNYHNFFVSVHALCNGETLQELRGGFEGGAMGLDVIPPHDYGEHSDRFIVGDDKSHVAVVTSEGSSALPEAPPFTRVLRAVRQWNCEAFVGPGNEPSFVDVRHYDLTRLVLLTRLKGHRFGGVYGLDVDVKKSLVFSFSGGGGRMWSYPDLKQVGLFEGFPEGKGDCYSCYSAGDLHLLIVGTSAGGCVVWDVRKNKAPLSFIQSNARESVFDIARVSRDVFASGTSDLSWWRTDGKIVKRLEGFAQITGVCAMGTPYDRFVSGESQIEDFEGRTALALSIWSCSGAAFVRSVGGRVVLSKVALMISV